MLNEKLTSSILQLFDVNTFINAAIDKDTDTTGTSCCRLKDLLLTNIRFSSMFFFLLGFPTRYQLILVTKATALHIAVESGNFRAVHILLQAGAQVNLCDSSFSTPSI